MAEAQTLGPSSIASPGMLPGIMPALSVLHSYNLSFQEFVQQYKHTHIYVKVYIYKSEFFPVLSYYKQVRLHVHGGFA